MKTAEKVASSIGKGLVAGVRRDRRDDRLEHARGEAARPAPRARAPARATAKALGIASFEDGIAQARFNDLSHWGYGTGWGVVRGLLDAAGLPPREGDRGARRRDLGQRPGHAARARGRAADRVLAAPGDRDRRVPSHRVRDRDRRRLRAAQLDATGIAH